MKFTLTINMGNDTMQSNNDVADALKETANKIKRYNMVELIDTNFPIFDLNGSKVGSFKFEEE